MKSLGIVWCLALISRGVISNPSSHLLSNEEARMDAQIARESSVVFITEEELPEEDTEPVVTMKPTSNIYDYELQEQEQAEIDRFLKHFYEAPAPEETTPFDIEGYGEDSLDLYPEQDSQAVEASKFFSMLHPYNYYFVNKDNYLKYLRDMEKANKQKEEDLRNGNTLDDEEDYESNPLGDRFKRSPTNLYEAIQSKSITHDRRAKRAAPTLFEAIKAKSVVHEGRVKRSATNLFDAIKDKSVVHETRLKRSATNLFDAIKSKSVVHDRREKRSATNLFDAIKSKSVTHDRRDKRSANNLFDAIKSKSVFHDRRSKRSATNLFDAIKSKSVVHERRSKRSANNLFDAIKSKSVVHGGKSKTLFDELKSKSVVNSYQKGAAKKNHANHKNCGRGDNPPGGGRGRAGAGAARKDHANCNWGRGDNPPGGGRGRGGPSSPGGSIPGAGGGIPSVPGGVPSVPGGVPSVPGAGNVPGVDDAAGAAEGAEDLASDAANEVSSRLTNRRNRRRNTNTNSSNKYRRNGNVKAALEGDLQ